MLRNTHRPQYLEIASSPRWHNSPHRCQNGRETPTIFDGQLSKPATFSVLYLHADLSSRSQLFPSLTRCVCSGSCNFL